jgi:hypothetical protein
MLAVLAALDLEFRIVARGKSSAADIEDIFLWPAVPAMRRLACFPQQGGNRRY